MTEAFAKGLFKLMAYKDEYEVARLYADGEFAKALKEQFDGDFRAEGHPRAALAGAPRQGDRSPAQARIRPVGASRRSSCWRGGNRLRGTAFDPFGYTSRAADGARAAGRIFGDDLPPSRRQKPLDLPRLVALAKSADLVRGYGHIKEANVAKYRQECARLQSAIGQPLAQAAE